MDEPTPSVPSAPPALPPAAKSRTWLKVLLIVIGFLVILGLFGNLYLLARNQKPTAQTTPTPTSIATTPAIDPTANWKTYQNKNGYSIKYPPTLTVVPNTGWKEPEDIAEATGISVRNQSLADPLKSPQFNLYVFSPEDTVYKGLNTLKEIAEANFKDNDHPETLVRVIEGVHESQFMGEVAYEYSIESKGFFAGWSGFLGDQGVIKIITLKHNGKYFQIGLYDTPVFDQILSTFKFLDQNQTDPTAGWKTYTSQNGKYSLKYPQDWTVQGDGFYKEDINMGMVSVMSLRSPNFQFNKFNNRISISVSKGKLEEGRKVLELWAKESNGKLENIGIDEIAGHKLTWQYSDPTSSASRIDLQLEKNGLLYDIELSIDNKSPNKDSDLKIGDQILSTLQFLP